MFLDTVQVDLFNGLPVLILGSKSDIGEAEVKARCQKNRAVHFLVSTKTGENVTEAVNTLVGSPTI
jgi:hypothetical protein